MQIKESKKEGEELSVGLGKEKMETCLMLMVQKHFGDGVRASRGETVAGLGGAEGWEDLSDGGVANIYCGSAAFMGFTESETNTQYQQTSESAFKTQHV